MTQDDLHMPTSSVAPSAPLEPQAADTDNKQEVSPQGAGSLTLSCTSEFNEVSYNESKDVILLAHLSARAVEDVKRAPVSITAVIDRSGSMAGSKLQLVKQSMQFVIRQLTADDQFGIVAYDDSVTVPLGLTAMTEAGKKRALAAIDSVREGGSTNLSGGLFAGIQQQNGGYVPEVHVSNGSWLRRATSASVRFASTTLQYVNPMTWFPNTSSSSSGTRSVWLFTDGLANAGITGSSQLVAATQRAIGGSDTTLYTFGFGSDHDANLLKQVAEVGHGVYYYIEDTTKIAEYFADCLGGLLSVAAKEIELELEVPARHRIVQSFTWYPHTVVSDRKWKIKIHDMYGEEQRDIMLLVNLPNDVPISESVQCGAWSLNYTDTIANKRARDTGVQLIGRPERANPVPVPEALDAQRNRVMCTEALETSKTLANDGKLDEARDVLQKCINHIQASPSSKNPLCVDILKDLTEAKSRMAHQRVYAASGKQMMECYEMSHKQQRSTIGTSYTTAAKCRVKSMI